MPAPRRAQIGTEALRGEGNRSGQLES